MQLVPRRASGLRPRLELPATRQASARALDAVLALGDILRAGRPLADAFAEMVTAIRRVIPAELVSITFVDGVKEPLFYLDPSAGDEREPAWEIIRAAESFFARTGSFRDFTALVEQSPRRWVCLPLTADDGVHVGLLAVACAPHHSNDQSAMFVAFVARLVARSLSADLRALKADIARDACERILATVSHDLRNPLGVIAMSASELLQEIPKMERRRVGRRQLQAITRNVVRMQRLIADLVDRGSIDAGALSLRPIHCHPSGIVHDALEDASGYAAARAIELVSDVPVELPLVVVDAERLVQVLTNIVGNALKFTSRGGRVSVHATCSTPDEVTFVVRDSGKGIAPEQLPNVFNRYWQARPGAEHGAGLGLSICKELVEASGGRIWVESEVGAGTTVAFTVPAVV